MGAGRQAVEFFDGHREVEVLWRLEKAHGYRVGDRTFVVPTGPDKRVTVYGEPVGISKDLLPAREYGPNEARARYLNKCDMLEIGKDIAAWRLDIDQLAAWLDGYRDGYRWPNEIPDEFYTWLGRIAQRHSNLELHLRMVLMVLLELESPAVAALVDGWQIGRISQAIRKIAKVAVVREDHRDALVEHVNKAEAFTRRRNRLLHAHYQLPLHHRDATAEIIAVRSKAGSPWKPDMEGVHIDDLLRYHDELDAFLANDGFDMIEVAGEAMQVMRNQADRHYERELRYPDVDTPLWPWEEDEEG